MSGANDNAGIFNVGALSAYSILYAYPTPPAGVTLKKPLPPIDLPRYDFGFHSNADPTQSMLYLNEPVPQFGVAPIPLFPPNGPRGADLAAQAQLEEATRKMQEVMRQRDDILVDLELATELAAGYSTNADKALKAAREASELAEKNKADAERAQEALEAAIAKGSTTERELELTRKRAAEASEKEAEAREAERDALEISGKTRERLAEARLAAFIAEFEMAQLESRLAALRRVASEELAAERKALEDIVKKERGGFQAELSRLEKKATESSAREQEALKAQLAAMDKAMEKEAEAERTRKALEEVTASARATENERIAAIEEARVARKNAKDARDAESESQRLFEKVRGESERLRQGAMATDTRLAEREAELAAMQRDAEKAKDEAQAKLAQLDVDLKASLAREAEARAAERTAKEFASEMDTEAKRAREELKRVTTNANATLDDLEIAEKNATEANKRAEEARAVASKTSELAEKTKKHSETVRIEVLALKVDMDALESELASMRATAEEARFKELLAHEAESKALAAAKEKSDEAAAVITQLGSVRREKNEIQAQLDSARRSVREAEAKRASARLDADNAQRAVDELKGMLAKKQVEKKEIRGKPGDVLNSTIAKLEMELETKMREQAATKERVAALETELQTKMREQDKIGEELRASEGLTVVLRSQIRELRDKLKNKGKGTFVISIDDSPKVQVAREILIPATTEMVPKSPEESGAPPPPPPAPPVESEKSRQEKKEIKMREIEQAARVVADDVLGAGKRDTDEWKSLYTDILKLNMAKAFPESKKKEKENAKPPQTMADVKLELVKKGADKRAKERAREREERERKFLKPYTETKGSAETVRSDITSALEWHLRFLADESTILDRTEEEKLETSRLIETEKAELKKLSGTSVAADVVDNALSNFGDVLAMWLEYKEEKEREDRKKREEQEKREADEKKKMETEIQETKRSKPENVSKLSLQQIEAEIAKLKSQKTTLARIVEANQKTEAKLSEKIDATVKLLAEPNGAEKYREQYTKDAGELKTMRTLIEEGKGSMNVIEDEKKILEDEYKKRPVEEFFSALVLVLTKTPIEKTRAAFLISEIDSRLKTSFDGHPVTDDDDKFVKSRISQTLEKNIKELRSTEMEQRERVLLYRIVADDLTGETLKRQVRVLIELVKDTAQKSGKEGEIKALINAINIRLGVDQQQFDEKEKKILKGLVGNENPGADDVPKILEVMEKWVTKGRALENLDFKLAYRALAMQYAPEIVSKFSSKGRFLGRHTLRAPHSRLDVQGEGVVVPHAALIRHVSHTVRGLGSVELKSMFSALETLHLADGEKVQVHWYVHDPEALVALASWIYVQGDDDAVVRYFEQRVRHVTNKLRERAERYNAAYYRANATEFGKPLADAIEDWRSYIEFSLHQITRQLCIHGRPTVFWGIVNACYIQVKAAAAAGLAREVLLNLRAVLHELVAYTRHYFSDSIQYKEMQRVLSDSLALFLRHTDALLPEEAV